MGTITTSLDTSCSKAFTAGARKTHDLLLKSLYISFHQKGHQGLIYAKK